MFVASLIPGPGRRVSEAKAEGVYRKVVEGNTPMGFPGTRPLIVQGLGRTSGMAHYRGTGNPVRPAVTSKFEVSSDTPRWGKGRNVEGMG